MITLNRKGDKQYEIRYGNVSGTKHYKIYERVRWGIIWYWSMFDYEMTADDAVATVQRRARNPRKTYFAFNSEGVLIPNDD